MLKLPGILLAVAALAALSQIVLADSLNRPAENKMKVPFKAPPRAYAFHLRDVRLLDGPFRHAQEMDRRYLLSLDVDRLLHNFRLTAGLPSFAKPLGGWEAPQCELHGHFVGHYLTAASLMYASTDDPALKEKVDRLVAGLVQCQGKFPSGYLSAFPEEFIDRVEAGRKVWAPWYTLHKILAGLIDAWVCCDNAQALQAARKMADWYVARSAALSEEQFQKMLACEHGGMNDCLAELYAVTGEEKYLALARRFNHRAVLDPLARGEDRLTGLHANTQFPKVIGAARQYELTGREDLRTLATYFWRVVTRERSYVIGGNSDGEHFSPKEHLSRHIGPATTETCNTYNMLKLTRHLFAWGPDAELGDYYERALYNHILASQNPADGMMCYYVPLRTGQPKTYSTPLDSFWCCVGTGVENHAKYGDSIYFHDGAGNNLYLNLFIASTLDWKDAGVRVRQETAYPERPSTKLTFACKQPVEFILHVRHPYWATAGATLAINGDAQPLSGRPGSLVPVRRTWKDGDTLELTLPMTLRTEGFRDNPLKLAVLYGPLVLSAEVPPDQADVCAVVGEVGQIPSTLRPVEGMPLTFAASWKVFRSADGEAGDLVFRPYYQVCDKPVGVYWDVLTEEEFAKRIEALRAAAERRKALEARIVDEVKIGDKNSEKAHALKGKNTASGVFNGRPWRHATDGGWFSYEMKVPGDAPCEVLATYWGSDGGAREFDILIDGRKAGEMKLQNNHPQKFFDVAYPVLADRAGQQKITVTFQARPNQWAGGVFGLCVLRKE